VKFLFLLFIFVGCNRHIEELSKLEKQIQTLKPGLGEIMSIIQQHHTKLYYSGETENWALAGYQLNEIREGLDQGTELHDHFKNLKVSLIDLRKMTNQSLSEIELAIQRKSKKQFTENFKKLTHSCNQCHQATEHEFIVIQSPTSNQFTNQRFIK